MIFCFADLLKIFSPAVIYFLLLFLFNSKIHGASMGIVIEAFYVARFLSQKSGGWRIRQIG